MLQALSSQIQVQLITTQILCYKIFHAETDSVFRRKNTIKIFCNRFGKVDFSIQYWYTLRIESSH